MNNEPIIRAMPDAAEFNRMADVLVAPESGYNDEQARAYINTVLTIANPEDDHSMHLANTSARHVFMKTEAFEQAFRSFAGYPERSTVKADRFVIHAPQEM